MGQYQGYEQYKDSGIEWLGNIPKHWELMRLKLIATVQPSNIDKKSEENEKLVLLCNYSDVYYHEEITSKINFMEATATQNEIDKFIITKGDVIVTKDSEDPHDIAVPTYVNENFKNVICGYHLTQIKPKQIIGKYLFRLFQATQFNAQFVVQANGVTRFGLPQRVINNALIPVPSLSEQKQIAQFLNYKTAKIDQHKDKIKKAIALLKEYRTALITNAVTGKIDVRHIKIPESDQYQPTDKKL